MFRIIYILHIFGLFIFMLINNSYGLNTYTGSIKVLLDSNYKNINVDNFFNINIKINSNGGEKVNTGIIIDGINLFEIKGKKISSIVELVGDDSFIETNINIKLKPKNIGITKLGPVKIPYGTGFIESNIIQIESFKDNSLSDVSFKKEKNIDFLYIITFIFFFLLLYNFYIFSKKIKKEDNYFNENIKSIEDIIKYYGKKNVENKLGNKNIKYEYNKIVSKINRLKYSKNNLNYKKEIKMHLYNIFYLLK